MSEPRVIRADYANWRPVAGRKVLQLVFEVPIEQTADVLEKLGVPMPGESRWCAVALLDTKADAPSSSNGRTSDFGSENRGSTPREGTKERRPFSTLLLAQQAALRCQDATFRDWVNAADADQAAARVRQYCKVTSRSEIQLGQKSGDAWLAMEDDYQAWLTDQRYAEARR